MISFGQFITEARLAPLYHGTTLNSLPDILDKGIAPTTLQRSKELLRKGTNVKNQDSYLNSLPRKVGDEYRRFDTLNTYDFHSGVSLSRSMKFASWYNAGKKHDVFVIEIDQQKLSQRYKIVPYQFFQGSRARVHDHLGYFNEYEEFVITTKPIDPKYFNTVYYLLRGTKSNESKIDELKAKYPHVQFKEMKEFIK